MGDELHFTRAARQLYLAQQAVSAQVRQLEDRLGTPLLDRTTRNVTLTAAGRALLPHAHAILDAVERALIDTRRHAELSELPLRMAYVPTASENSLPTVIDVLRRRASMVEVLSQETWPADAVSGVLDGRYDVALTIFPPEHENLARRCVAHEPIGAILGARDSLATGEVVARNALIARSMVIWAEEMSPAFYRAVVDAFDTSQMTITRIARLTRWGFLGDDLEARTEVAQARAFAVAPRHALPEDFVWRPLAPPFSIPVYLVYQHPVTHAGLVTLIDALKEDDE